MAAEFEPPHSGVSAITHEGGALRVTVPALVPWTTLVFVIVWLIAWTAGGVFAYSSLIHGLQGASSSFHRISASTIFLAAWCVGWIFGEVYAVKYLAWGLFGREHIIVGLTGLEHRTTCLGMSRSKSYQLSSISRFRTAPAVSNKVRGKDDDDPVPDASSISFDYGSKSVIMAKGMDDAEATRIVEEIQRFNGLLKPRDRVDRLSNV